MKILEITDRLRHQAHQLGFELCGVCPTVTPAGIHHFQAWLAAGYSGTMAYMGNRATAYEHPRHVLDGARSILMLGMNYRTADPKQPSSGQGNVSRYAWGLDYHDVIRPRLHQLADQLRSWVPNALTRCVVDSAPLFEREFAQLAGLGWIGKNTMLINRDAGSWFFLAAILTDQVLAYDRPSEQDHCGKCTACLDACPTQAFVAPHVLDARKCISYLTIEHRGTIPPEMRNKLGDWVFGCDICQEVCPWNRKSPHALHETFAPQDDINPMTATKLLLLDDAEFRDRFRDTPLWRPRRRGILRNAAMVLGNRCDPVSMGALAHGLNDHDSLVRQACAWGLGQYENDKARMHLSKRLSAEEDADVRSEIELALDEVAS